MKAVVSQKGQVTIPKALRERLGIGPGEVLEFGEEGGRPFATNSSERDPVDAMYGILQRGRPTDEIVAELRDEAVE